jgi:hypothetical protein
MLFTQKLETMCSESSPLDGFVITGVAALVSITGELGFWPSCQKLAANKLLSFPNLHP